MNESAQGKVIQNYILIKCLKENTEGSTWLAQHKICHNNVLIKIIPKITLETETMKTQFNREVNMAKQLRHPFISEFYECFSDDNYYYLVEEYAENGSIHDYITANGRLTEIQARRYFSQIILVLEYLHNDKYIAHRDLNTNNILLDRNCNVRVTSFGFSNIFTNQTPDLKTVCGLPAYASPEMIKGNSYTKSTDIWSSGIILYFLVTGNLPFEDENTQRLLQKIVYTDIRYPSFLSIPLVDLLKKLLLKDPEKRLTLEGIKEHIWFSQCEYNVIEQFKANYDSQSNVIDKEIVQKMSEDGVDCSLFNETLNEIDESNEYLILYKQLLRQKMTDSMNDLTAQLVSYKRQMPQRRLLFSNASNSNNNAKNIRGSMLSDKSAGLLGFPSANPQQQQMKEMFPGSLSPPRMVKTLPLQSHVTAPPRRLSRPVAVRRPISGMPDLMHKSQEM